MIRQQVGDLLEIQYEGKYYYVVVLTKIVMFGGNIVFAHHTDGERKRADELLRHREGFNVCTDLLLPKKEGVVTRLHRYDDTAEFWLTKYAKYTHEYRLGHKATEWFIYQIDDLGTEIARVQRMPPEYREAMDSAMSSFDLVAEMILEGYTPDQNPFLERTGGLADWFARLIGFRKAR
jgi:hypothetical protein